MTSDPYGDVSALGDLEKTFVWHEGLIPKMDGAVKKSSAEMLHVGSTTPPKSLTKFTASWHDWPRSDELDAAIERRQEKDEKLKAALAFPQPVVTSSAKHGMTML